MAQPPPLDTGTQAEVAALLGCFRFPFQHIQLQGGTEQAVVGQPRTERKPLSHSLCTFT